MPDTLIKVDLSKSAYDNDKIHNRWHPEVPIVEWVSPGDDFIIETVDWTGGFIKNNDSADDVRDIDLSIVVSEQVLSFALDVADRVLVIENGEIVRDEARDGIDAAQISKYLSV